MNVYDAYKQLELRPLDEYLHAGDPDGRNIGSTTWMVVSAAVHALETGNVVLVAHNLPYTEGLVRDCLTYISRLQTGTHFNRLNERRWTVGGAQGWLQWESDRTINRVFDKIPEPCKVFSDGKWKLKALEYRKGPYACIRKIAKVGERFLAHDEDGEFLMELTADGAFEMAFRGGLRVHKIGW
jgi:hypothetical protein